MNIISHFTLFGILLRLLCQLGNCEGAKSFIYTPTPDIRASIGTNVQLTCLVHHTVVGEAFTFVEWRFKGENVGDSTRIKKTEKYYEDMGNFSLSIVNVTRNDEGLYTCKVYFTNIGDKLPAIRINLTVEGIERTTPTTALQPVTLQLTAHVQNHSLAGFATQNSTTISSLPIKSAVVLVPVLGSTIGLIFTLCVIYLVLKRTRNGSKRGLTTQDYKEYKYDVFITYRSKDAEEWVKETLLPLLDNNNLKYCVHDIHWEPGRLINEHMVESVYQSRMVLALLSKNYMKSHFCKEELHYAIYRNLEEGDRSLIVLKIGDINIKRIPKEIRNRTFIDTSWKNWRDKLVKSLKTYYKTSGISSDVENEQSL